MMKINRRVLSRAINDIKTCRMVEDETFNEELEGMSKEEKLDREKESEASILALNILEAIEKGAFSYKLTGKINK